MTIQQAIDKKIEFYMDMSEKAQRRMFANGVYWIGDNRDKIDCLTHKYLHVHCPEEKRFGWRDSVPQCTFITLSCIQK